MLELLIAIILFSIIVYVARTKSPCGCCKKKDYSKLKEAEETYDINNLLPRDNGSTVIGEPE